MNEVERDTRTKLILGIVVIAVIALGLFLFTRPEGIFPITPIIPGQPVCGNFVCESGETAQSCPSDCDEGVAPPPLRNLEFEEGLEELKQISLEITGEERLPHEDFVDLLNRQPEELLMLEARLRDFADTTSTPSLFELAEIEAGTVHVANLDRNIGIRYAKLYSGETGTCASAQEYASIYEAQKEAHRQTALLMDKVYDYTWDFQEESKQIGLYRPLYLPQEDLMEPEVENTIELMQARCYG